MSRYFLKLPDLGRNAKVPLDLSNYPRKSDVKYKYMLIHQHHQKS